MAIEASSDMPPEILAEPAKFSDVETRRFNRSYIESLDQQIQLEPREPEWTEVLQRRRNNLRNYVGYPLVCCVASVQARRFWIKVDLEKVNVVHWEPE